jgi:hypothetical protein
MYNKEGNIKLETSAHYVPVGNTNIKFYDSDIGTADLIFYITRNQRPLEVSDVNVDCFLVLKANDGSYIVDKASVVDPLKGKAQYTIPTEFLKHTGKVQAQLFIAVHGVDKVVTEVDFTFEIQNSLLSSVPAVDKLNYIRTFDDLKERIEQRVQYIEESIENGDDYVAQMDATASSGMKALNDRSVQVINEIHELADNYKTELNEVKNNNITQINTRADQIKAEVEKLNNYDTTNWQKVKLTSDSGIRTYLTKGSVKDIKALNFGYYETVVAGTTDATEFPPATYGGFVEIDVTKSDAGRMQIKVAQSSNGRTFWRYIHTNGASDTGWLEVPRFADITTMETTTGSQNKANTAESKAKSYADEKVNSQHKVLFSGSVSNVGSTVSLTGSIYDYSMIVISGESPSGVFNEVVLPAAIQTNIVIQTNNSREADTILYGLYELKLDVTNGTALTVVEDVSFDATGNIVSDPNSNAFIVQRIEGWK